MNRQSKIQSFVFINDFWLKTSRILLVSICLAVVSACESTKSIKPQWTSSDLNGKSVSISDRKMPQFWIETKSTTLGRVLGTVAVGTAATVGTTAAQMAEGESIINEFGISDPSEGIAEKLIDDMVFKYGISKIASGPLVTGVVRQTSKMVVSDYADSDFVLDFFTDEFFVDLDSAFKQDSNKLRVKVIGKLIDVTTGESISRSTCIYGNDSTVKSYSKEDMLKSGAKILIDEIDLAIEKCIIQFRVDLIQI